MTEPHDPSEPRPAGQRGRLDIAGRAIERLATHAALRLDGVRSAGGGLDRMVGRALPRARSRVAGDQVWLSMEIAVVWPQGAGERARSVRSEVSQQVGELTGLSVIAVDVTVASIEHPDEPLARRVV